MKKADIVRELIVNHRVAGNDAPNDTLIAAIMERCGFQRQLARAYIKANWPKTDAMLPGAVQATAQADNAVQAAVQEDSTAQAEAAPEVVHMTLEEALARIPLREKGKFIAKERRIELAKALMSEQ